VSKLSTLGKLVEEAWLSLPNHFAGIQLHGHMVMPNHVHGIVEILAKRPAQQAAPLLQGEMPKPRPLQAPSLSRVVRSMKAEVTRQARRQLSWNGEIWQYNYYDRVLRDGREFANATRYIAENPVRWQGRSETLAEDREIRKGFAQQAAPLQRSKLSRTAGTNGA